MNELQLEIQKLGADHSLSKGCIVYVGSGLSRYEATVVGYNDRVVYALDEDCIHINDDLSTVRVKGDIEIIGHPITYSRLCYLVMIGVENPYEECNGNNELWAELQKHFDTNPELYNKSILERPEELQLLVRDFLLSIQ